MEKQWELTIRQTEQDKELIKELNKKLSFQESLL